MCGNNKLFLPFSIFGWDHFCLWKEVFTAETAEVMKTLWRFQELVHSKMIPTFNKSYSLSVVLYFTRNPPNLITAWALSVGGSGEKIKLLASSIFDSAPPSHQLLIWNTYCICPFTTQSAICKTVLRGSNSF